MAKKRRAHDDEAWRNAKTICRLNARQVEMARVLGDLVASTLSTPRGAA
jgi:hypothetical protein